MLLMIEAWAGLLLVVIALALYRKWVARNELDTVHLSDAEVKDITTQTMLAKQLNWIELTGKTLTVAFVIYSVTLVGRIGYLGWLDSLKTK